MATLGTVYITKEARSIKALAAAVDAFADQILAAAADDGGKFTTEQIECLWHDMELALNRLSTIIKPTDERVLSGKP